MISMTLIRVKWPKSKSLLALWNVKFMILCVLRPKVLVEPSSIENQIEKEMVSFIYVVLNMILEPIRFCSRLGAPSSQIKGMFN